VRKKVGDMRFTLPAGVQGPFFNDEFGDVYGVIYALESDGFSYAELKTFADDVRQQLLRVPDVAKVELFGVQDEKLFIEISQKRLAQLGLDMNQVLAQLGQQNAVEAPARCRRRWTWCRCAWAGSSGAMETCAMPIRGSSGNQLRLGDIADIKRGYVDPPARSRCATRARKSLRWVCPWPRAATSSPWASRWPWRGAHRKAQTCPQACAGAGAGPAQGRGPLGQRICQAC
jgi:multidrug efflux pump subunit AcrB